MVLATGWLILRWLHKMLSPKLEDLSQNEKMCARLEVLMTNHSPVKTHAKHSHYKDDSDSEVSVMKQELLSMQAVIEMRTQEVRRLRKELDRREGWREDIGTQTDKEGVNAAPEW